MIVFLTLVVVILLIPHEAWAWAPGTHLNIAEGVLRATSSLPGGIALIITRYIYDFMYGMIGADVILGKNLAPYHEHCHNWKFAFQMLKNSVGQRQKAFSYGYLAHLASDTISHNFFIPSALIRGAHVPRSTHIAWEYWADSVVGGNLIRTAPLIIKESDRKDDELMERTLKSVLFSFKTNKRLFSSLIFIQRVNNMVRRKSPSQEVKDVLANGTRFNVTACINASVSAAIEVLREGEKSRLVSIDPTGRELITAARVLKKARRTLLKRLGHAG